MSINKEIWISEVQQSLFKGMEWFRESVNGDEYVNFKTVHIPNAGSIIGVSRNRTQGSQASVSQQNFIDVSFSIDEFTSNPTLVTNLELAEIHSDKLTIALKESIGALRQSIGDWQCYNLRPTTGSTFGNNIILRTSGSTRTAGFAGTTGNRNALCLNDIIAARKVLNLQNAPVEGRHMIMDSNFYNDIIKELGVNSTRDASRSLDIPKGAVDKLFGFTIWERSTVILASSGSSTSVTFRSPSDLPNGQAPYVTDNAGCIFYSAPLVIGALGEINVFENDSDPTYYGSIISVLARCGMKPARAGSDYFGVGAIIET
jgi:hypothetical protein